MTFAYWCVLIGAMMPLIWTAIAKWGGPRKMPAAANRNPREFLGTLTAHQKRADWAQQNAFEAFPAFAAAVIIANIAGAPLTTIDSLAAIWIIARLLHGIFYVMDLSLARSLAYFVGMGCVIGLFVAAA